MKAIQYDHSIRPYTTFKVDARSAQYVSVDNLSSLKEALQSRPNGAIRILGGGSNMLWRENYPGRTIHINLKGIEKVAETDTQVSVKVQAGENWHEFVLWALKNDLGGIENLALIPGSVGAAPIQNIGAYGVELKEVMEKCTFLQKDTLTERILSVADCQLNYRNSIFKNELKGKGVVTSVQFRLTKSPHRLHTSYGALEDELQGRPRTIQSVAEAVIRIRQNKLPDPKHIGNCGSFFKNPILSLSRFEALQKKHPQLPSYPSKTGVKLPAAWLIDQLGFKGVRRGDAGVHHKQALVLVNHGNATGAEIWALAEDIQKAVHAQFGIALEPEVTCY